MHFTSRLCYRTSFPNIIDCLLLLYISVSFVLLKFFSKYNWLALVVAHEYYPLIFSRLFSFTVFFVIIRFKIPYHICNTYLSQVPQEKLTRSNVSIQGAAKWMNPWHKNKLKCPCVCPHFCSPTSQVKLSSLMVRGVLCTAFFCWISRFLLG